MDRDNSENYSHAQMKHMHDQAKKQNEEKYKANSKNKLIKRLSKGFNTTMIGALDTLEKNFGYLWGHEKDDDELTENELVLGEVWQDIRNEILDNGHNQKNLVIDELECYSIRYEGYSNFKLVLNKKDRDHENF